ncbi:MAG: endonuclease/exonuclease/phosphatase family protein [Clostridia bacterium]|nr:endonuclease/exonuclease/phosphatase family protein [Clostridia bacterium]
MFKGLLSLIVSALTAITAIFTPASAQPTAPLVNVNPNPIKQEILAQDLTVMTYNLKCSGEGKYSQESRKDAICTLIKKYSPDSLGVQEADKNWVGLLNATLTDYANVGTYRDDGISEGESNNIFYKKDKYELVDSGDFWLSKTPDVPSRDWDSACYRICTYAVLKDKATGFVYAHFNTHFDHVSDVAQAESVALISSKIAEIAPDIPVVLTGDFNFNETVEHYDNLLSCGFSNTKYLADDYDLGATYNGYKLIRFAINPIDHIFVNGYVKSVKSSTIDKSRFNRMYPSDHFPVIVEMTMFNG